MKGQGSDAGRKVIVVGAGPAGIFAVLELQRLCPDVEIVLFEKGEDIDGRHCFQSESHEPCRSCRRCSVTSGWGGAGAYSDGKLCLSSEIGGNLRACIPSRKALEELLREVDGLYCRHGAPDEVYRGGAAAQGLGKHLAAQGLELASPPIRHMGTERSREVLRSMRRSVEEGTKIHFRQSVKEIAVEGGVVRGVVDGRGRKHEAAYVLAAPGREGAEWLSAEARRLDLERDHHPVDLGVRVELPAALLAPLTDLLYEVKVRYRSSTFSDPVRTFCMCPGGEVVQEKSGEVILVNGQSYQSRKTALTNFAILVSTDFTEPFHEPIAYGKYIARLANLLGGGILVQRLEDLRAGRRSTAARIAEHPFMPTLRAATPGDLSFVFPYRILTAIEEMLRALGRAIPGIDGPATLLYGVEAKFYSLRLRLSEELESSQANLFAAGDGAGVSRGLVQASASGLLAARAIARRMAGKRQ